MGGQRTAGAAGSEGGDRQGQRPSGHPHQHRWAGRQQSSTRLPSPPCAPAPACSDSARPPAACCMLAGLVAVALTSTSPAPRPLPPGRRAAGCARGRGPIDRQECYARCGPAVVHTLALRSGHRPGNLQRRLLLRAAGAGAAHSGAVWHPGGRSLLCSASMPSFTPSAFWQPAAEPTRVAWSAVARPGHLPAATWSWCSQGLPPPPPSLAGPLAPVHGHPIAKLRADNRDAAWHHDWRVRVGTCD